MALSEKWYDQTLEEYLIYLETLDKDRVPMDYQSFEWLKIREAQEEDAERQIVFQN